MHTISTNHNALSLYFSKLIFLSIKIDVGIILVHTTHMHTIWMNQNAPSLYFSKLIFLIIKIHVGIIWKLQYESNSRLTLSQQLVAARILLLERDEGRSGLMVISPAATNCSSCFAIATTYCGWKKSRLFLTIYYRLGSWFMLFFLFSWSPLSFHPISSI